MRLRTLTARMVLAKPHSQLFTTAFGSRWRLGSNRDATFYRGRPRVIFTPSTIYDCHAPVDNIISWSYLDVAQNTTRLSLKFSYFFQQEEVT